MIPVALFPCQFTDGARIVGELANALQMSVYTDAMILQEVADGSGATVRKLQSILFGRQEAAKRKKFEREKAINWIRGALADLLLSSKSYIYYGMFSSLVPNEQSGVLRVLVVADEQCRLQRAVRQEGISERAARRLIRRHDEQAAAWTQLLHHRNAGDPLLYDSVIRYGCQDLLDVASYIYMIYEENSLAAGGQNVQAAVARNMKLTAGVENVLLEKGVKAEVKACSDRVEITVAAGLHCLSWFTSEMAELLNRIDGFRTFRIKNVASNVLESGRKLKVCFTADKGRTVGKPLCAAAY